MTDFLPHRVTTVARTGRRGEQACFNEGLYQNVKDKDFQVESDVFIF